MSLTKEQSIDYLVKEYENMQKVSLEMFSHYYDIIYLFAVGVGAILFILLRKNEGELFIEKLLPIQFKKFQWVIPYALFLVLSSWSALWLYMNKELHMTRLYLAGLEEKIRNLNSKIGYYYYSDFIRRPDKLYGGLEGHPNWGAILNIIILLFMVSLIFVLGYLEWQISGEMWKSNDKCKKMARRCFVYMVVLISGVVLLAYLFVKTKYP